MKAPKIRYFEDVTVGDALPPLEMTATLTSLIMYAGATWDFHRYHYDAAFVAQGGMPAPFMDGQMIGALLARQLMLWGGPDAFVRRLAYRQRAMVYVNDSIIVTGKVIGTIVEDNRPLALCLLSVAKPDGTAIVRDASGTVELNQKPV
jgi:acyl dehydratase